MIGRPWRAGAVVVLGATLVAGCGGSSGNGKKTAASTSASQPASTAESSVGATTVPGGGAVRTATEGPPEAGAAAVLKTVSSWGNNSYAQLGSGARCLSTAPAPCGSLVPGPVVAPGGAGSLNDVRSLAAGAFHTLAIRPDRTVLSWGFNQDGELGNGSFGTDNATPSPVLGANGTGTLGGITAIGGGGAHSLAVGAGGAVWAWGDNIWGQLGLGTATGPKQCPVSTSATQTSKPPATVVPAGGLSSCATVPTPVLGPAGTGQLNGITAVSGGNTHSVALARDGTVWTWGLNDMAQLGDGNTVGPDKCDPLPKLGPTGCSTKPVHVVGPGGTGLLSNIIAVTTGSDFTLALRSDGTVWAWGSDAFQGLGQVDTKLLETCHAVFSRPHEPTDTPIRCSSKPLQVVGPGGNGFLTGVRVVSAEGSGSGIFAGALLTNGTVWMWGVDDTGQIGNGQTVETIPAPTQVVGPGGNGFLTGVSDIAAGGGFTFAVKPDGTVWAWGENVWGDLGINTATGPQQCTTASIPCSTTPVQVLGLNGAGTLGSVTTVAAGDAHAVAAGH